MSTTDMLACRFSQTNLYILVPVRLAMHIARLFFKTCNIATCERVMSLSEFPYCFLPSSCRCHNLDRVHDVCRCLVVIISPQCRPSEFSLIGPQIQSLINKYTLAITCMSSYDSYACVYACMYVMTYDYVRMRKDGYVRIRYNLCGYQYGYVEMRKDGQFIIRNKRNKHSSRVCDNRIMLG